MKEPSPLLKGPLSISTGLKKGPQDTLQARRWLLRAYADLGHMPAPLRDEIDRNLRQRNALVARALQRWQVGQ